MRLSIPTYGPLHFEHVIPSGLMYLRVNSTVPYYTEGNYGSILYQVKETAHYRFVHTHISAKEDFQLVMEDKNLWMGLHLQMENHLQTCHPEDKHFLKQGQLIFAYFPEINATSHFRHLKKMDSYTMFDLCPSAPLFESMHLELYNGFLRFARQGRPYYLANAIPAYMYLWDSIHCLMSRPGDRSIIEKILRIFEKDFSHPPPMPVQEPRRIECMFEARQLIRQSPQKQIFIPQLAKKVGVNVKYLKKDFPNVFGMTPGAYFRYVRNYELLRLLATTEEPLHVIADILGLSGPWAINHLFASISRMTPLEWRRWAKENGSYCRDWIGDFLKA